MFEGIFDIKNDRRLSVYLYRMGFGMWLMYLVLGAPALAAFKHYRSDCGMLSMMLMVVGFSASMVFEYFHNPHAYEQKKKWLFVSYFVLAIIIYFLEFKDRTITLDADWTTLLRWLS
ncbi:hypothetical protein [Telluribacter sp.]|jgi:predicted membrane-bound spermidine synthase|uniref:hypothetical protein n=1 Tax=Telluribacter sp. TaxID=1978767 RepID=UPI002E14617F|nr:hypothetical protein [Telluribacter sp.]